VGTVADATALRCPEHDVELEWRPHGETIRGMRCPMERDSMLSTSNRFCSRCGARDASWISGTCDRCYRVVEAAQRVAQRESQDASAIRRGLSDAIDAAVGAGADEVAAWLRVYLADQP
jgi:hypothetical protein